MGTGTRTDTAVMGDGRVAVAAVTAQSSLLSVVPFFSRLELLQGAALEQ